MTIPNVVKVTQQFENPEIDDLEAAVAAEFGKSEIRASVRSGMKIAIATGSRGIHRIADVVRYTADRLKALGAEPFIVPAMGSHGGATAEGQVEVLNSLGISASYCGAPIRSSMEVRQVGQTADGVPVYMDRYAYDADGVVVIGRIKAHTDFKSELESGLMKMASIGLGKHRQAETLHTYGVHGIRDIMPEAARVVLSTGKVLFGIGIVENARDRTAVIEAIPSRQIEEREKELLLLSKKMMPSLPVDKLDILYVDEIGKNYSGTGMDTNIIGRIRIQGVEEPRSPRIKYIIAGDLSEASHGNALGIGLADLTTERLFRNIDFAAMNENVITSSFLDRAKIPIVLANERDAMQAAIRACWGTSLEQLRFMRIRNTLDLSELFVSESLLPELEANDRVQISGTSTPLEYDRDGRFAFGWDKP